MCYFGRCQDVLLDQMKIPQNIARNVALRENVFMMTICIELRIPLFLVGKPGSSKSLAKTIVSSSLSGQNSTSDLLKKFKQVKVLNCFFCTIFFQLMTITSFYYFQFAGSHVLISV